MNHVSVAARRVLLIVCFALVALPGAAAQEEKLREQDVLDPESDAWVTRPAEEAAPGTIDEGRELLARGKSYRAHKVMKKWLKKNPDDDRHIEGVFLLAEAYFDRGWFHQAYENYLTVIENSSADLFNKSLRRSMDCARAFLSGQKRIVWGFLKLPAEPDGVKILDAVWERVPGTRMGEDALKLKSDYQFERGELALAQQNYAFLAQQYPRGRFTQAAILRSAEAAAGDFPGVKFDEKPLLDAQERYQQFEAQYPAAATHEGIDQRLAGIREQRAEADLSIARWYRKTKQNGAAEFYLRAILKDWPETLAAADARRELRSMGIDIEPPVRAEVPDVSTDPEAVESGDRPE